MEFSGNQTGYARMVGLGNGDSGQSYTDIDFAIALFPSGDAHVYENGAYRAAIGSYTSSDVFQVAVESGVVKYKKNGTVVYTSTVAPTYPLLVDSSIYSSGCTISNVVISGGGGGSSAQIHWLVTDQLGTPRMIFDQSGSLTVTQNGQYVSGVSRHDYLPFGEELFAGTGGRTTAQGYSASDNVRQQFTQKERDNETGLDYFGARYYSSTQGRFTSVDPSRKSIHPLNPQSWNRYSYTYNNPLVLVDDNGKWPTSTHNKIIDRAFDALSQSKREQIKSGSASVDANWNKPARLLTENTLMESQAYKHAMTPGAKVAELGSVGAAQKWANAEMYKFIDAKLGEAQKQFQAGENRNGVNNAALVTFGEAVHPIMDNMSPAHRWMQVYDLQPYLNTASNAPIPELAPLYAEKALYNFIGDMNAHSAQEARDPTQDEMNTMVDQMRTRYLQTFGQEAYEQAVSREERDATERRLRPQRQ